MGISRGVRWIPLAAVLAAVWLLAATSCASGVSEDRVKALEEKVAGLEDRLREVRQLGTTR